MSTKMLLPVFSYFLAYVTISESISDEISVQTFDVKPGGMVQEFVKEMYGVTCKFIYAAQGGTKEEWSVGVEIEEHGSKITCSVSRPGGMSYLFFQQFRLEVHGAHVTNAVAEGASGENLSPDEYTVGNTYIEHVEGRFQSQMSALHLVAQKINPEL